MSEKEGRLSSIPDSSPRNCRQTIVKLLISAVQFWTCIDEFCSTLPSPLAGISIYSQPAHRDHMSHQQVTWLGTCHYFLPLQWAVKLWCRESYIIALWRSTKLPVEKTYFSTVKWVIVVYGFVAVRHLVQGYLLIPNLIQINGNLSVLGIHWGIQIVQANWNSIHFGNSSCAQLDFFNSFWDPKETFYRFSVPKTTFILPVCKKISVIFLEYFKYGCVNKLKYTTYRIFQMHT